MRVQREEGIWIDEFENESALSGTLNFTDEKDESGNIYIRIGSDNLGFISKSDLVKVAEKIIELWKPEVLSEGSSQESSKEKNQK